MKSKAWDGKKWRTDFVIDSDGTLYKSGFLWNEDRYDLERVDWKLIRSTGRVDYNGREAWQGDVFYYWESLRSIEWIDEYSEFIAFPIGKRNGRGDKPVFIVEECEIIGNVFENPELIETTP